MSHPTPAALLAEPPSDEVRAHLAGCPRCRVDRRVLQDASSADLGALPGLEDARAALRETASEVAMSVEETWAPPSAGPADLEGLLPRGRVVDRYEVQSLLGRGGMAVVYRVRHLRLGSQHALKVLLGPHASARRLLLEGQLQSNLRHPNIVAVTDVVDVDGAPGLVMEYVSGPSLAMLLRASRIDLDDADRIAVDVIRGVAAAHHAGLVHRDLKPHNILLATHEDRLVAKVADFGLAKVLDAAIAAGLTGSRVAMGTPQYMAPEQILDARSVDQRADLFALGAVLYELVTGTPAFRGAVAHVIFERIAKGRYADPRGIVPDLPDRMADAIEGCLVVDPARRIGSCDRLLEVWTSGSGRPASGTRWSPGLLHSAAGLTRETILPATPSPSSSPSLAPAARWAAGGALLVMGLLVAVALGGALGVGGALGLGAWESPPAPALAAPVVSQDPAIQGRFATGWEQFLSGDLRDAQTSLDPLVSRLSGEPRALLVTAAAHDLAGDPGGAWPLIEQALAAAQGDPDTLELARLYESAAYPGGDPAWPAYLRTHPDDLLAFAVAGRHAEKAEWLIHAQDRAPEARLWPILQAQVLQDRGEWKTAEDVLRAIIGPQGATLWEHRARYWIRRRNATEARDAIDRALLADPASPDARFLLALLLGLQRDAAGRREQLALVFSPTSRPADRLRLARTDAWYEFGSGHVRAARSRLDQCRHDAELAARDTDAVLCADQAAELALRLEDAEALREGLAALHEVLALPGIPTTLTDLMRVRSLYLQARLALLDGDLEEARRYEERLVVPPPAKARWSRGSIEFMDLHWRVDGASVALEFLDENVDRGCWQVVERAEWDRQRGDGGDARIRLERLMGGETSCHASLGDRYWEAQAHVLAAEIARDAGQPDLARVQLDAFEGLWPDPDPSHPLVERAEAVAATVGPVTAPGSEPPQ